MIIEMNEFSVLWGDASWAVNVKALDAYRQGKPLIDHPWHEIRTKIPFIETLFFAHQVHGSLGYIVSNQSINQSYPWTIPCDYLLTNVPGIALGVLTADCLPIAIYDPLNHASAIIHAGWRSAVAGIVATAIEHMNEAFNSRASDLKLFFGPCAGSCCYSVGQEIIGAVGEDAPFVTEQRGENVYFDLAGYNKLQAERAGVPRGSIDSTKQICTICDARFCSYRREKEKGNRQISLICLNNV